MKKDTAHPEMSAPVWQFNVYLGGFAIWSGSSVKSQPQSRVVSIMHHPIRVRPIISPNRHPNSAS
jgi:hypothetical protein